MKVDVSSIVKTNGASLSISYNEVLQELSGVDDNFLFSKPVDFKGVLVNASGMLKLEGLLKVNFTSRCSRCLKDMEGELGLRIRESFLESDKNSDSEAYTYDDNYILIDGVLKDNIILNLPVKQVCSESCMGLCQRCGVNLNEKECSCRDEEIHPQMEVLKKFFNN